MVLVTETGDDDDDDVSDDDADDLIDDEEGTFRTGDDIGAETTTVVAADID